MKNQATVELRPGMTIPHDVEVVDTWRRPDTDTCYVKVQAPWLPSVSPGVAPLSFGTFEELQQWRANGWNSPHSVANGVDEAPFRRVIERPPPDSRISGWGKQ